MFITKSNNTPVLLYLSPQSFYTYHPSPFRSITPVLLYLSPQSFISIPVLLFISIFVTLYIIIIMSRRQHRYPWPSLAISPYHSSPLVGLQSYILCPHIVAVCKFVLVVLLLHIHMWGSTGVHRLWARPCFSSSVPRVWFVWLV